MCTAKSLDYAPYFLYISSPHASPSFTIGSQFFLLTLLRIVLVVPLSLCPSPPASSTHIPFIMFTPCTCDFVYLLAVS
jgi:hypothetical protein